MRYAQRSAPAPALTRPDRPTLRITKHCSLGGVVSPILSNIYLHKLDQFVETVLIPQHTKGRRRKAHPVYTKVQGRLAYARGRGNRDDARRLR